MRLRLGFPNKMFLRLWFPQTFPSASGFPHIFFYAPGFPNKMFLRPWVSAHISFRLGFPHIFFTPLGFRTYFLRLWVLGSVTNHMKIGYSTNDNEHSDHENNNPWCSRWHHSEFTFRGDLKNKKRFSMDLYLPKKWKFWKKWPNFEIDLKPLKFSPKNLRPLIFFSENLRPLKEYFRRVFPIINVQPLRSTYYQYTIIIY